jgi:hypothetical protein
MLSATARAMLRVLGRRRWFGMREPTPGIGGRRRLVLVVAGLLTFGGFGETEGKILGATAILAASALFGGREAAIR